VVPLFYLDTSVFGGYFDEPFREATRAFWAELVEGRCRAVVSRLTVAELVPAPAEVRELLESLAAEQLTIVDLTDEMQVLADRYVSEGVVGPAYRTDAVHVAAATVGDAKAVLSWNFKHLVNLRKIEAFNGINLLMGYRPIDIRTPGEVLAS